jgi:hypothetical protein
MDGICSLSPALRIMTEKNIQGAPAIVVEVLSKSLPRFRLLITSC